SAGSRSDQDGPLPPGPVQSPECGSHLPGRMQRCEGLEAHRQEHQPLLAGPHVGSAESQGCGSAEGGALDRGPLRSRSRLQGPLLQR
ncbi:unnamed protein product, partial [Symbiodinium sp. CCMP2456]